MNGILIGSFLICVSTDSVVSAEEVPTEILSEPVNDARDSKDKLIEVLNKENELTENSEAVAEEIEVNHPSVETPEQNDNVTSPTESNDVQTELETNVNTKAEESESEEGTEESDEAGVSNEENTGDTSEEPVITEPEVPTEEENPGDGSEPEVPTEEENPGDGSEPGTGNEDTDNGGDTSTPNEPGEGNNEPTEGNGNDSDSDNSNNEGYVPPSSEIDDLDDKVKDAFKPIEIPEEDTTVEKPTNNTDKNTTSQNNDTSKQESKTIATDKNTEKKVTKYNIDRLPETGITDNIELIYIFEIIILGFALLLLSFKPVRKSHKK